MTGVDVPCAAAHTAVMGATTRGGARRALITASIGSFVGGYDLALYGFFAVLLSKQFFPPGDPTAALLSTFMVFAIGFAVRPLGGLVFGHVGDRLGRRPALAASILLMAVGTLAISVLPPYGRIGVWAAVLLLACRMVQGLSIGGEVAGGNVFVLEHARTSRSGRAVSANLAANSLGYAAAAGGSLVLAEVLNAQQLASWGWRIPFAVAGPLGLIGVYLRMRVADTPHFQALDVTPQRFPLSHAVRTATRGILLFAGFAAMALLGGYLLIGYLPSYLARVAGLSTEETFKVTLITVVVLAGSLVLGGVLVDRFSPRVVAMASALAVAVAAVPGLLIVRQGTLTTAVLGAALWAVVLGVANTAGTSLSLMLFPTPIRFTATALALNVTAAVFGGTGPYVSTWLVASTGNPVAPGAYLTVVALASLIVAIALPRTGRNHSVEAPAALSPLGL